ncbi:MAG: nicotinate-nucleotide--dimethylbenzimidazole phosphoribosyltransferase [Pseudomonadota bacterium]
MPSSTQPGPSAADIQAAIDAKTKPIGALGRVEDTAVQLARLQGTLKPKASTCRLLIFAADHGLAQAGVSAYPQAVTRQMVANMLSGGACANAFASALGAIVSIVDAGVGGEAIADETLIDRRIAPGTQNSLSGPAMTPAQYEAAIHAGKTLAQDAGEDVICLGEMGIGNTASASLLAHKIAGLPLEQMTGRGTGLDDAGLARKTETLRKAAARTPKRLSADSALQEYGGFEIVMMAGAVLGAASARKPVIIDGFIATAAALAAHTLEPSTKEAMIFGHVSEEQGHASLLATLNASPLLSLDMRLGEGTGALLAWPIVKAAAAMLRDVASFESAGVSTQGSDP